jgi:hypothetical protein
MTIAVLAGYKSELITAAVAPSPRTAGATDSRDGGTPFWIAGLVRRSGDRNEHLRRSAACVWDQGQIVA